MRREQLRAKAENLKEKLIGQIEDNFNSSLNNLFDDILADNSNGARNGGVGEQISSRNHMDARKVFKERQSLLTELLEVSHIRTIYNIFVAILIVFSLNTLAYDYIEHGRLVVDFSIIFWAFGNVSVVVVTWLLMQIQTLLAYPLFIGWVSTRSTTTRIVDFIWLGIFFLYLVVLFLFPLNAISNNQLPPVSRVILVMEQIRFYLKMHAFVREVAPRIIAADNRVNDKKNSDDEKTDDDEGYDDDVRMKANNNIPGFSQFLYFLFAPTLVYRDSYPQTPKVRWKYVVSNFAQVVGCVFYTYYIFARFCVPVFRDTGKNPPNLKSFVLSVFNAMLPGTLVLVLGFFCILHSWLNAFAEMMKFADRMFYRDWWNASSYADYYRTWNVVVHDWLYAYFYRDFYWLFYGNRSVAMIATFFLSAIVHEYILIVTFNFFFPILFIMFFGIGVSFVFLKPKKGSNVSPAWNVFMWVTIIIGSGLLMVLYCLEWYAVQDNPKNNDSLMEILTPRSWALISK
ncbi:sterol O-acyltransferase 1-like isoform X2 [Dendronephthya gigantea]|nr:sterol O-acyltransferase 1-like isoform X2 [Dendronephthya gigantea]